MVNINGNPPTDPKYTKTLYNSKMVPSEIWVVREQTGDQLYALVREPNTRPYTKVSVIKLGKSQPIKDAYGDIRVTSNKLGFR